MIVMDETFDLINEVANYTSAGTSQLSVSTSTGIEQVGVENLSGIDSDIKLTDLGQLYSEFPDKFAKIQRISFRESHFYNCFFSADEDITILRFDSNGTLMSDR